MPEGTKQLLKDMLGAKPLDWPDVFEPESRMGPVTFVAKIQSKASWVYLKDMSVLFVLHVLSLYWILHPGPGDGPVELGGM